MKGEGQTPRETTVRFAQVVKEAGTPEPYTLWSAPDKDPVFQKAMREDRVLTLIQGNVGSKKDYGLVGYHEEQNASYLIFPRPIRGFEGKKVVGIKYDLLAEPTPIGPRVKAEPKPKVTPLKPPQPKAFVPRVLPKPEVAGAPKTPEKRKFKVTITATVQIQIEEEVEAANQKEAKTLAQQKLREQKPELANGKLRVTSVKPVSS